MPVKVIDIDRDGKIKLSRKEAMRDRGQSSGGGGGHHQGHGGHRSHGGHDGGHHGHHAGRGPAGA